MSLDATLTELEHWLQGAVGELWESAWGVEEPAGTNPRWEATRARWSVEAIDETERTQIRSAQRPTRGAPAMEVHRVALAIVREGRRRVKPLDPWEAPATARARHARLLRAFDRLERDLSSAWRTAVVPAPTGMFGNVFASLGQPTAQSAQSTVVRCPGCGAPRLVPADAHCAFCESPFFGAGQ